MKLYCARCGKVCLIVTPDRKEVKQYRPGAVMLCAGCLELFKIAEAGMNMARTKTMQMPDFLNGLFK